MNSKLERPHNKCYAQLMLQWEWSGYDDESCLVLLSDHQQAVQVARYHETSLIPDLTLYHDIFAAISVSLRLPLKMASHFLTAMIIIINFCKFILDFHSC